MKYSLPSFRIGKVMKFSAAIFTIFSLCVTNIFTQENVAPIVRYTNKANFDIYYNLPTDAKNISKAELWVTEDGGDSWKSMGVDADLKPPINFTANKDGVYGMLVLIEQKNQNKIADPIKGTKPQWLYILDRKKPELNLEFQKKLVFKSEGEVPIKWIASDAHLGENPVTISLSIDKGKTWTAIQTDIKDESPISLKAPTLDKSEFQFKVTIKDLAGNETSAITETLFVDGALPTAKVIGPNTSIKKQFELQLQLNDEGKAGISGVNIWFTQNNGSEWVLFSRNANPQSPIVFSSEISKPTGFYATAIDSAGNEGIAPAPGTTPQHVVLIDGNKPIIEILEPKQFKTIGGDKRLTIKWVAKDDNLKQFPIAIYFSSDNGNIWQLVTKNEKAEDSFLWYVPKIDAEKCLIKITAIDEVGNIAETLLPFTFEIDSTAPISKAMYLQNKDITNVTPKEDGSNAIASKNDDPLFKSLIEIENLKSDKQFELAMDKLQKLEDTYPNNSRVYYEKALILSTHLAENDPLSMNKAINLLEKAISINPEYEAAYILRGSIYYKKFSLEKDAQQKTHYLLLAEHEYLNAIKILGDNYEEYSNLGIVYFRLDRMEESKKYLLKATLLQKNPGICYWYLARIEESQENFEKSENYWRKAANAYGVNTIYGEKAVLNAESAKSKKIGKQILD